ncbi:MAG: hypothetical protein ACLP5E_07640 [Streptosporangiaceae bacterium]
MPAPRTPTSPSTSWLPPATADATAWPTSGAGKRYHGEWIAWARYHYGVTIEIVARPEVMKGFQVLPWRWAAE